jgi:serine/threonine protein kinase
MKRSERTWDLTLGRFPPPFLSWQWRSPEEYKDLPLDEKIDIFSLGNNVFSILTGLVPFYDLRGSNAAKQSVVDGVSPRVDPRWSNRSFAEGKLVELIGRCQAYKPEDRIDAGAAVQFLRDAVRENDLRHSHEDGLVPAGRRP